MISIIIPVYNQANKLHACLASIGKQTYDNYEIIIVDDGSTDQIEPVFSKYKKIFGFKLIYLNQPHQGANTARNCGAARARGEYLLFCDADVIMKPEMLALMLQTLKDNSPASFCYSSFKYGLKTFKLWPYDENRLKQMPYIHTTSLVRREHFPGFDPEIKRLQDWDLWLTMLEESHTGIWIDQILFTVQTGGKISHWLPSFSYKFLPFLPAVKKYQQAVAMIKQKHGL